jgi:hypothetical protein
MPGDDAALLVDENRIGEAELGDRGGDPVNLRLRVGAGVVGIRCQAVGALDAVLGKLRCRRARDFQE